MAWGEKREPMNPVKRVGGMLTDLTEENCDTLLAGLAHLKTYNYVDTEELIQKLIAAKAFMRQER